MIQIPVKYEPGEGREKMAVYRSSRLEVQNLVDIMRNPRAVWRDYIRIEFVPF